MDRWILSRLQHVIAEVDEQYEEFELAKVCDTLYHFAWDDVCDWYVELAKPVLAGGGPAADTTRRVLGHVLDQRAPPAPPDHSLRDGRALDRVDGGRVGYGADQRSRVGRCRAVADHGQRLSSTTPAETEVALLQTVVTEVRRFRADQGLKPGQRVVAELTGLEGAGLVAHERLIRSLARIACGRVERGPVTSAATATLAVAGGIHVALDTRGVIDLAAERARLAKDRLAAEKEAAQCRAKLDNPAFTDRAPADVVAKIGDRLATAEADLARITAALEALAE